MCRLNEMNTVWLLADGKHNYTFTPIILVDACARACVCVHACMHEYKQSCVRVYVHA
jgi:hypothetical protein